MSRDHMSAIRGKLAGLNTRAQAVNTAHAARGRDIANTDFEASYHPGTGSTGPRSSDVPDPTHAAALRLKPSAPGQLELDTLRALDTVAAFIHQLETWARWGDSDPDQRPETSAPCKGGHTHYPRPDGRVCALAGCGKPWPCRDGEDESWWEPCPGTLGASDSQCRRCELSRSNWVCRDCPTGADVHDRTEPSRNGLCDRCRKRRERATDRGAA